MLRMLPRGFRVRGMPEWSEEVVVDAAEGLVETRMVRLQFVYIQCNFRGAESLYVN